MKTSNGKPFFRSILLQKDLLMSASLSSTFISRVALCRQAPVVMQQETILLSTLPDNPKFVGTLAEPPELPSTSPLVASSSEKAADQEKVRIWTCFLCSNWGPGTPLEVEGKEQEVRRKQASTSQGQQSQRWEPDHVHSCHYLSTPTSGQSLPLHLGVSILVEGKADRLLETLLVISLFPLEPVSWMNTHP